MGEKIKAVPADSIPPGGMIAVTLGGKSVLLVNIGGTVYAASNVCTHEEAYLNEGRIEGTSVVCPLHESEFDLKTGEVLLPPAENPLPVYKVTLQEGQVYVEIP